MNSNLRKENPLFDNYVALFSEFITNRELASYIVISITIKGHSFTKQPIPHMCLDTERARVADGAWQS